MQYFPWITQFPTGGGSDKFCAINNGTTTNRQKEIDPFFFHNFNGFHQCFIVWVGFYTTKLCNTATC